MATVADKSRPADALVKHSTDAFVQPTPRDADMQHPFRVHQYYVDTHIPRRKVSTVPVDNRADGAGMPVIDFSNPPFFLGDSDGGGDGEVDPPLIIGTHDLVIGTDGAGTGYYAATFGDLTPPDVSNVAVEALQVNAVGTMLLSFAGDAQINGSLWIDVQASERNPSRLSWNPSFSDYRDSGYTHVWEFLNNHVGDTIPINIIPQVPTP
jgi:hypothetical protein